MFGLETDRLRKFWEGKALSAPSSHQGGEGSARPPSLVYACHGFGLDGTAPSLGCSPILGGEGSARPRRWLTRVTESAWTEPRPPLLPRRWFTRVMDLAWTEPRPPV